MDLPDPGWGSPVSNSLDHGWGYLQPMHRNHFDSHCGMEVVLANGHLLRTGMGAMPGPQIWQQYKFGFAPWIDSMSSQSNLCVVTKMGFWLMPEPDAYLTGTVTVPQYEELVPISGEVRCYRISTSYLQKQVRRRTEEQLLTSRVVWAPTIYGPMICLRVVGYPLSVR